MISQLIISSNPKSTNSYLKKHYPSSIYSHNIETNTSIKIKDIKDFISKINLSHPTNERLFHYIHNAHNLTNPAQNALLKTLEEPPNNTTLILISANKNQLLETIISRCQIVELATDIFYYKTDIPLKELVSKSYKELISLSSKLAKESPEFLLTYVNDLRIGLRNSPSINRKLALSIINETYVNLKTTNANHQLLLESCFFRLKQLSKR